MHYYIPLLHCVMLLWQQTVSHNNQLQNTYPQVPCKQWHLLFGCWYTASYPLYSHIPYTMLLHHTCSDIPLNCSNVLTQTYPFSPKMCTHISYCYILFILLLKKYHVRIYIKNLSSLCIYFCKIKPLDLKWMLCNLRLDSRTRTRYQDIVVCVS